MKQYLHPFGGKPIDEDDTLTVVVFSVVTCGLTGIAGILLSIFSFFSAVGHTPALLPLIPTIFVALWWYQRVGIKTIIVTHLIGVLGFGGSLMLFLDTGTRPLAAILLLAPQALLMPFSMRMGSLKVIGEVDDTLAPGPERVLPAPKEGTSKEIFPIGPPKT